MIYLIPMGQAIAPTMLRAGCQVVHSRGDGLSSPWSPRNNCAHTLMREQAILHLSSKQGPPQESPRLNPGSPAAVVECIGQVVAECLLHAPARKSLKRMATDLLTSID